MTRRPLLLRHLAPTSLSSALVLGTGIATMTVGCGSSKAPPAGTIMSSSVDRSRCNDSGKQLVTADTNGDSKPDVWKMYVSGNQGGQSVQLMTCKQVDLNHDARVDIVGHYDDTATLSMEEFDLDFDGKFEMRTIYQGGKRTREEMDTNFDGRPDISRYYEGGKIVRIELDGNNDGRVDEWQYYVNGQLDRVGYDTTGSGRVDKWERGADVNTGEAAAPTASAAAPPVLAPGSPPAAPAAPPATK